MPDAERLATAEGNVGDAKGDDAPCKIERFVATLTRSADIKTVTLTEIAHGLRNGTLTVRAAA